jgi:hypothetical protein
MNTNRLTHRAALMGVLPFLLAIHCSSPAGNSDGEGGESNSGSGSTGAVGDGDEGGDGDGSGGGDGGIELGGDGNDALCPVDELDFLFVIDNSVSMADKQELLREAVPNMVNALVNPPCLTADGSSSEPMADGSCPDGAEREYAPLDDIHIGVISSSLGGHGSASCPRAEPGWNNDDQARLIPSVRTGVAADNELGFLAWQGGDTAALDQFITDFTEQVAAVGETGCGYEAPLEAWYRFLVDPAPPLEIVLDENDESTMSTDAEGNPLVDGTVLEQREAFLRPQSLVNIIVLTDENDCSMMDGGSYYSNAGFGYLVADPSFSMKVATDMCEANPNDECCFSCSQTTKPAGCDASACDASVDTLPREEDRANVRCFANKRRFGVDLMYPTDRYVDALSERRIVNARLSEVMDNPLLMGAGPSNEGIERPNGRVYFTGIVGVPWQDLVTAESLDDPEVLEYLSAEQLSEEFDVAGSQVSRWEVMLGRPGIPLSDKRCKAPEPPAGCGQVPAPALDPFMQESIAERTPGLTNPISGDAIVASTSNDPTANNINGHEANHQLPDGQKYADGQPANDDLQYACTFPLTTPKLDCARGDLSCDCGDEPSRNRPLCQAPEGGAADTSQYYGKAYPGTRVLEVLRDFGDNSIVSSICPKGDHGYIPAVKVIIDSLKACFPPVVK